jgi:DNA-binding IclR family transcriptional regulator
LVVPKIINVMHAGIGITFVIQICPKHDSADLAQTSWSRLMQHRSIPQRPRIREPLPVAQKTVKSAGRVLEILEYFDDVQQPATVMEVADTLGYPQSSTSALLRSLVALGYLDYDRYKRTYVTSHRVALLGSWLNSDFVSEGSVISLMKELGEMTGDTIILAMRNGLYVQYIHIIQATSAARLHVTLGTTRPLAASGSGFAMLSTMSDQEIKRIVMRINAEAEEGKTLIKLSDVMHHVAHTRDKGYAFSCDAVTRGGGVIAAPLPGPQSSPALVIGIGGISEVMRARENELATMLTGCIGARLGKRPPVSPELEDAKADPLLHAILRSRMVASSV